MQTLQAEAATWLVRLDAGSADITAFEAWRDADPRHRVAYAQAIATWEAMECAGAAGAAVAQAPAASASAGYTASLPVAEASAPSFSRRSLLRAAAVALPVMAGGGLLWQMMSGPAYAATTVGEQRRFQPVPGLFVVLNTSSRIGWQMRDDYCELWLDEGEAALVLSGGALRQVLLHCGDHTLFLGTGEYNIRRRVSDQGSDAGEVLIMAGTARVAPADGREQSVASTSVRAGQGERISLSPMASRIEAAPSQAVDAAAAWRRGEVVFSGETLGAAIGEYNRYLDRKLVIHDPAVRALRIGGRFETLRPDNFLSAVSNTFDLRAVEQPGMILIERNSAGE